MSNIYARGVPERSLRNVTITTHDWGKSSTWTDGNSNFEIKPDPGEIWVLFECRLKFSSGMDFGPDNRLTINGIIDGLPTPIPITSYDNICDFMKRADRVDVYDLMADGGSITRPVSEISLYFSEHVVLWSSAGLGVNGPHVDMLGEPKLSRLLAGTANNQPFTIAKDGSQPEIAICRYFLSVHEDPDYIDE